MITLVKKQQTFIDKEKNERVGYNYYVVFNGKWICVRPTFKTDYQKLNLIATDYNDFEVK